MKIVRALENMPPSLRQSVLAIGNFDGVHKGHQAVIRAALGRAKDCGSPCGVMTFEPHPRQFFAPDTPLFRLTGEERKLAIFDELGVDFSVVLPFDEKLASLSAEEFVKQILLDGLGVSHVVTGFDFFFGHKRGGTPELMVEFGAAFGFGVTIVEAKSDDSDVYSSSRIRDALRTGAVDEAARMLGHWWQVNATVESGDGRGRTMGFPTINLTLSDGQMLQHGIYAVRIYIDGERYHGAAYLGRRPTFETDPDAKVKLEAFLFDFSGDLYGKDVSLEFIKFLRQDAAFDGEGSLAAQMAADCDAARLALRDIEEEDPYTLAKVGD